MTKDNSDDKISIVATIEGPDEPKLPINTSPLIPNDEESVKKMVQIVGKEMQFLYNFPIQKKKREPIASVAFIVTPEYFKTMGRPTVDDYLGVKASVVKEDPILHEMPTDDALKFFFNEKLNRNPTDEELSKLKQYLINSAEDPTEDYVIREAIDYLIVNWINRK